MSRPTVSKLPVEETYTATPQEERAAFEQIYKRLEDWLLTHPIFTPIMVVVPDRQDSQQGRGT